MLAKDFKTALGFVKYALSPKDFIPMFSHFSFKDKEIVGFSEPLGISVSFDHDIVGGIKGDLLSTWVNGLADKATIKTEMDDGTLTLKSGHSKIKQALLDLESFAYVVPEVKDTTLIIDEKFINGLEKCLISVNQESTNPYMSGITVTSKGMNLVFYSTDGLTLSEYVYSTKQIKLTESITLPYKFCMVLIKLFRSINSKKTELLLSNDYVSVKFNDDYNVYLWSKLYDTSNTKMLDFNKELNNATKNIDKITPFLMTNEHLQTIKRVLDINSLANSDINIQTKGNTVTYSIDSSLINSTEVVTVDDNQREFNAKIDISKLMNTLCEGCAVYIFDRLVMVTLGDKETKYSYLQAFKNG